MGSLSSKGFKAELSIGSILKPLFDRTSFFSAVAIANKNDIEKFLNKSALTSGFSVLNVTSEEFPLSANKMKVFSGRILHCQNKAFSN